MTTRPHRKNREGYGRRDKMNARNPTGSRAADPFMPLPTSDVDSPPVRIAANGSTGATWDGAAVSTELVTCEESRRTPSHHDYQRPRSLSCVERDILDELMEVLKDQAKNMLRNKKDGPPEGLMDPDELADAFRHATELPPITKQSLSELDIQNIISNTKLRHDVNFDRDLSFRPNNDGSKGHQKNHHAHKYWLALQAELHLYARLFQGTPPLRHVEPSVYFRHAQRRIPKLFDTIHDILKSLVPDRDHARVDEHLDVRMLMQEIERGVCDMVALVEWTARLLKEHCAPMRDCDVDRMVQLMREGATNSDMGKIITSLSHLLAMLETMKLDVANHQIRNLKPLLIEDTVTYEKHYHLDRIVKGRAKVDVDAAQRWWADVVRDVHLRHATTTKDLTRARLTTFTRAVISSLCPNNRRKELPDTFYLDSDRLRCLRLEIEDLVHYEMCFTMLNKVRKELGHTATISNASRIRVRSSLAAIQGEFIGHGYQAWMYNSESVSLEIYRQAHSIAGQSPVLDHRTLQYWNERLRSIFQFSFASHATAIESDLLPQILSCLDKHYNSSPAELYSSLVATPSPSSTPSLIPSPPTTDTFSFSNNTPQTRLGELSKRISHIVLLHWRIWAPITYVEDDAKPTASHPSPPSTAASSPHAASSLPPAPLRPKSEHEHDVHVVKVMKTGEPPESGSGYESSMSEETRLP